MLTTLPLLWLVAALPSGNQLLPERLLQPAEFIFVTSGAGAWSNETKTPTGTLLRENFSEAHFDLNARAGVARFVTLELNVPLVTHYDLQDGRIGTLRVGDPTFGVLVGHALRSAELHEGQVHFAALGEIQTPSDGNIVLRLRDTPLGLANRGAVITTGGVTAKVGAMVGGKIRLVAGDVAGSARGYYRIRSNGASDGIGFDLRLQSVWVGHVILGAVMQGMFAVSGSNRAFISASREGDSASWLDLGGVVGFRPVPWLDILSAFMAPAYRTSSGNPITVHLAVAFTWQPLQ